MDVQDGLAVRKFTGDVRGHVREHDARLYDIHSGVAGAEVARDPLAYPASAHLVPA